MKLEAVRKAGIVLFATWGAASFAGLAIRLASSWRGTGPVVVVLVAASLGATVGVAWARDVEPLDERGRRDAVIGWSVVLALAGAIALATLIETA